MRVLAPMLPILALGVVSQIAQVLLLRELLMVFYGSELSIGVILAAWLLWVGVGSRLGAFLIDRIRRPRLLLLLNAGVVSLLLPVVIVLSRQVRGFFTVLPGAYLSLWDIGLACLLLVAPVGLLLGLQFVLLARIWRESDRAEDSSRAGRAYYIEAGGNVLGGLLFTLVLVHYLSAVAVAAVVGLLLTGATAINQLAPGAAPTVRSARLVLGLLLAAAILVWPWLRLLDQWSSQRQWRLFLPEYQLVKTEQSKYGAIAVLRRGEQFSFFQSGNLVFSSAGPAAVQPGWEEQEAAVFAHLALVQHLNPRRVLLIGGGLRGTLSEILKHPLEQLDYVELDEVLTAVAQSYVAAATTAALKDPRLRLIHGDGRLWVKTADRKYDLVIVDVPDPMTAVLNRFYTVEFFREAKNLLQPGGVFVCGLTTTPGMQGAAIANRNAAVYHTLRSVFNQVLAAGDRYLYYFAAVEPGQISLAAAELYRRYSDRSIATAAFSAPYFFTLLNEPQLRRINWRLHRHGRRSAAHREGPEPLPLRPPAVTAQEQVEPELRPVVQRYFINSDFRPLGYLYTLMYWLELTRGRDGAGLDWLLAIQFWWLLPVLTVPLFAAAGLRLAGRRRAAAHGAVAVAVFTTGFSTMVLQIALLFAFQSIYGFVYEMMGLIIALFMAGLALGALGAQRWITGKDKLSTLGLLQLLMAVVAAVFAVLLPQTAALASPLLVFLLFAMITGAAGLISGMDFPIAVACAASLSRRTDHSAGAVYGLELYGAGIGAVLASVVIVPLMGISACCLLAALVNAVAFGVILVSRYRVVTPKPGDAYY